MGGYHMAGGGGGGVCVCGVADGGGADHLSNDK